MILFHSKDSFEHKGEKVFMTILLLIVKRPAVYWLLFWF